MELGTPDVASMEISLGIFEPMSDGALDTMNDGTAEGIGDTTLITGAAVGTVVVILDVGAAVVVIIVGAVVLLAFSSTPPSSLSLSGRVMILMVSKNKSCSGFNNRPPTRRCCWELRRGSIALMRMGEMGRE